MVGNGFRHELGYGFVFTTIYELVDELALPGPEPDMKAWLRHGSGPPAFFIIEVLEIKSDSFMDEIRNRVKLAKLYVTINLLSQPFMKPDFKGRGSSHGSRLGVLVHLGPGNLADTGLPVISDDEEPEVAFFKVVEVVADGLGNEGGDGVKLPAFHIRLDFPPVKLFDSISKRHDIPLYYTSCDISTF